MTVSADAPGAARRSNLSMQRLASARWFLAPMIIALALVAGWPLLRSIWFSFTDTSLNDLKGGQWVGFDNYFNSTTLKSGKTVYGGLLFDPEWWNAVWNTIRFAVMSVGLETFFGMIVALVLNAEFKGRGLVRAAILIPWAIPTIVSAKMWGWMLNDQFGIFNDILMNLGLISEKIAWTSDPDTMMFSILLVDVWKTTPFMALLILAGLQMVPKDVYEAATIDGVSPIKQFFRITLPLIKPALMVAVIFRLLDALRIFDLIYVLTPNNSQTKTMSVIVRENMFDFSNFAYGSAQATVLFLIIAGLTMAYIYFGKVRFDGGDR